MSDKDNVLIQQFLDGVLSADEFSAFENRLKNEPELQKELELFKAMDRHLELKVKNEKAINALNEFKKTEIQKRKKPKNIAKWLFLFAILMSLILLTLYFSKNQKNNNSHLYAEYFNPETISIDTKSLIDYPEISEAHQLYHSKQYKQAITLFEKNFTILTPPSRLAYALSLSSDGNETEARNILKSLENIPLYKNSAYWYLSLIDLKQENSKSAKEKLLKIDKTSSYYSKAQKILNEL